MHKFDFSIYKNDKQRIKRLEELTAIFDTEDREHRNEIKQHKETKEELVKRLSAKKSKIKEAKGKASILENDPEMDQLEKEIKTLEERFEVSRNQIDTRSRNVQDAYDEYFFLYLEVSPENRPEGMPPSLIVPKTTD